METYNVTFRMLIIAALIKTIPIVTDLALLMTWRDSDCSSSSLILRLPATVTIVEIK